MKAILGLCLAMWACGASSDATGANEPAPDSGTGGAAALQSADALSTGGADSVGTGGATRAATGGSVATGGTSAVSTLKTWAPDCTIGRADLGCKCSVDSDCFSGFHCVTHDLVKYVCCTTASGDICKP